MGTDKRGRRGSESRDSWNGSDPVEIVATLHNFPPRRKPAMKPEPRCTCRRWPHSITCLRANARDTYGTLLTPRERAATIAALRHCQGMGHPLPLTEAEIDALCKRLGDQQ